MAGFKFFQCSCENIQNHLAISLVDESLYFVHSRNCKQGTMYYIQETKTVFEKFFTLIPKRNTNL